MVYLYFCSPMLDVQDIEFAISDRFTIGPIHLSIEKGKHVAIIGESGCGKTTLLKIIYGLYDVDRGTIYWNSKRVTGPKDNLIPGMPHTKYLSQNFDLMPFTSVRENIQKYLSRLQPIKSRARTDELLEVVEMTAYASVKVKTLSGGQMQRVALAQTLAKEPELLLLDEPFSHIDNFRKNKLRRRLFDYLKKQDITCIVATHDRTDVLSYMDEIIVMKQGMVVSKGVTQELYKNPPSYYVGSLFGDINEVPRSWFDEDFKNRETVLVYPHQLAIASQGIKVRVNKSYFMGNYYLVVGTAHHRQILFNATLPLKKGKVVFVKKINSV